LNASASRTIRVAIPPKIRWWNGSTPHQLRGPKAPYVAGAFQRSFALAFDASMDSDLRNLRTRAQSDRRVFDGVAILWEAKRSFESALVADRLAMMAAFHEVRWCGVELPSFREARVREEREPDPRETPALRIKNDAVSESHISALESRRKTAATALLITLDRLFDALWARLGLPQVERLRRPGHRRGGRHRN
jgi:hypothetical protein